MSERLSEGLSEEVSKGAECRVRGLSEWVSVGVSEGLSEKVD